MLDLEGVNLSLLVKGDEEVFLCYELLCDSGNGQGHRFKLADHS